MSQHEDADDAHQQYEEMDLKRRSLPAKRFAPASTGGYASVWAPLMNEQQRKEHEQYVKDNGLPF
jgi:hypothetical protein